ncbi:putative FAD NAD-P-binding domain-containing protein [Lyophyllum shimeji]|uniref:FAD NAD-P-binding domain-containing protein n=1 Tax=Lyophyllum shimeji TaxID=47721 RepID=A0A9P3PCQ4_LYOSH|nr:putative FAD NAD-P-binding domain-containing protein [Lyophyllum shimeji]
MDDGKFDVTIIGTGLTESIAAAALAKAGFKVAHLDENPYYGGAEASLSLDELAQWADAQASSSSPKYTSISRSLEVPSQTRQYSVCLSPSVIPSIGPIISSLVSSGVAKYGGFRLLEHVGVYHPSGVIKNVPGTKEDIFKSKEIALIDKRRLMRFLMFAVGDFEDKNELKGVDEIPFGDFLKDVFSLKDELHTALVFALAFCFSTSEPTLPALHRIRRYLRSVGRYGPSPFLVGHYGGSGEIAQGFCRAAAVSGGVYILGRRVISIAHSSTELTESSTPSEEERSKPLPPYSIALDDFPDTLTSHIIISSASHVPPHLTHLTKQLSLDHDHNPHANSPIARCIAVVDHGITFPPPASSVNPPADTEEDSPLNTPETDTRSKPPSPLDAGIFVFPPSSVAGGSKTAAATVLITGEGTMSTPKGKWIWYIALPLSSPPADSISAEQLLQPYLDAMLSLTKPPTPSVRLPPSSSPPAPAVEAAPHSAHPRPKPLFTLFYIEHPDPSSPSAETSRHTKSYVVPPPLPPASPLPDVPDAAATSAEAVFWEAVKVLRDAGVRPERDQGLDDVDAGEALDIQSFWPLLETGEDSGGEEEW